MRTLPYLSILIIFLAVAMPASAQQTAFLNHFSWNPRLFNPAAQGVGHSGEIAVVYRNQFQELDPSVRPTTYMLHADLSPYLLDRIGLSIQLLGDKTHLLSRTQGSVFFAYHLIQNRRARFSLGVSAGVFNQKFEFSGVRVSDVLDLLIFNNQVNASRFDGGPGLAFEYRTGNGSFFALDAAATQLFSSDIRIDATDASTAHAALYDLVPHLLANARYRYQGKGFAIEPNVVFRALGGSRKLRTGMYDLNLNAYFLKDNRLMVGGGMRTGQEGFHMQLGVSPAHGVTLFASGEMHAALGASFEVGASYSFGAPAPAVDPVSEAVQETYKETASASLILHGESAALRSRLAVVSDDMMRGAETNSLLKRAEISDQAIVSLAQIGRDIQRMGETLQALETKHQDLENLVRDALRRGESVSPDVQRDLTANQNLNSQIRNDLNELVAQRNKLVQKCLALQPVINEGNCIRAGDAECVQERFSKALQAVPGIPQNLFPLEFDLTTGAAAITYHFPNDESSYQLSPALRNLAGHIADQVNLLAQQGIQLESLQLITELQEDKNTLDYVPGIQYKGEFGNSLPPYTLIDNESGEATPRVLSVGSDAPVSLEGLGLLKLTAVRKFLLERGIPPGVLSVQLRYNHTGNTYREESRIVLKVRG